MKGEIRINSNGSKTFYTKYGDIFAWLCGLIAVATLFCSMRKSNKVLGKGVFEDY